MKKLIISLWILSFGLISVAQDTLINDANLPEAEFHVAINPNDTNNIIIATIHGFGDSNGNNFTIYYTNDFGVTWQTSDFHGEHVGYSGAGDPVLGFDGEGNVLLVNLTAQVMDVKTVLSKSEDGGATWSLVSTVASGNTDKPWLAVDRNSSSPNYGNIYIPIVENPLTLYTLDDQYSTIHSIAIQNGSHLPSACIAKNGDVFLSAVDLTSPNFVFIAQSTDGGASFEHSTEVVSFPDYAFNAPNISKRFQATVYTAIDNSGGTYDGRLYLSYTASEEVNEDYFDVFLTYSDDNGLTWSTPKIVHSDQQESVQQFYSSLYVNDNGVLILDWYDRKNFDNTNKNTDFFMGISYDGGDTFTELQLNSLYSDFDFVIPSSNNFGIGEYHQLVATDNTAIAFWSDGRTNDQDLNIYMAKVSINNPTTGVEELSTISDKIRITNIYPQPVIDIVNVDIDIQEKTQLKCLIIDNAGKVMYTSEWKTYDAGQQLLNIPCNFKSGVYYLTLMSEKGYFKSMKLIQQ